MTRNSFELANDGSLLGETVEPLSLSQGEGDRERIRPGAPEEHERDQDEAADLIDGYERPARPAVDWKPVAGTAAWATRRRS